ERCDINLALFAGVLDCGERRLTSRSRTEREDRVDVAIGGERRLHLRSTLGRFVRDRQHGHLAAEAFGEALAAKIEGHVSDFLVYTESNFPAHFLELLAGRLSSGLLVLADVKERAQGLRHVRSR